jgi:hypothetical protein
MDLSSRELREIYTAIALHGLCSNPNIEKLALEGTTIGRLAVKTADEVVRSLNERTDNV